MHSYSKAALVLAVALAASGCRQPAPKDEQFKQAPVETPTRKPGLWTQTMSLDGADAIQSMKLCLDQASDAKIAWWGQQGVRGHCDKNEITKNPDGSWSFSSSCQVGGVRTVSTGRAVGNFEDSYQVTAETTTSGAPQPQMNGTRSVTIDAVWESECPPGMQPGDVEMPGGQRVNLLSIAGGKQ